MRCCAGRWSSKRGGERRGEVRAWDLPERGSHQQDGRWFVLRDLALPADLPPGYHRLHLELEFAGTESCPLIVTPDKCHEPATLAAGARLWGVAVQLYTLRSASNWGIGDFTDLKEVLRLAAAAGRGLRRHQSGACACFRPIPRCIRRTAPRAAMR